MTGRASTRAAASATNRRDDRATGIALAFVTALVSGVSIFVNAAGVKQVPDAAVYTTGKNLVAALILLALLAIVGGRSSVRSLDRRTAAGLGLVAIVGGSVPFVLFFSGLAVATAPSAAFIQKTLFVWVALLAVPFLGERLGWIQVAALAVLLGGQILVAPPRGMGWGTGETMIGAATLLWAVEVVLARRLLRRVDAPLLGAARMGLGVVVLLAYLAGSGRIGILVTLSVQQWSWIALTGVLLAGYVTTWFAALRRAPATLVTSILVAGAIVTAALTSIQQGGLPGPALVGGHALILVGAIAIAVAGARPRRATGRPAEIAGATQP